MNARNRVPLIGLLAAQVVSLIGTRMSMIALPWFTLAVTGSAIRTGVIGFAEMLPFVLACGLGGPLIDRVGARRMAVLADLTSGAVLAAVPLLYHLDRLHFGTLVGLVAAVGLLRGLGDTAKRVLFPDTVAASGMPMTRATSLYDGMSRLASLLGAALVVPFFLAFDASAVLLVDAATFGAAAVIVTLAVARRPVGYRHEGAGTAAGGEPYLVALRSGLRYLRRDRLMLGIVLMLFVTNLADAAYQTVLAPVWAKETAGSAVALGLLSGCFGVGAVLGNVVFTVLAPKLPRFAVFAVGFLVAGAPRFLALTLDGTEWLVYTVSFFAGLGAAALNPILGAAAYERIPERLRARVLGLNQAVAWSGIPLGGLLAGLAVDHLLLPVACLLFAGAYLVATLAPFVVPSWRELDRRPPAAVDRAESGSDRGVMARPADSGSPPGGFSGRWRGESAADREHDAEQGQGERGHREQNQQIPATLSAGSDRGDGGQRR